MDILLISTAALLASLLTFFSGFGLGTIMLPVFAFFFPVEAAVALTGIVHFANNAFKTTLIGNKADRNVLMGFGIPAVIASFAGAWILVKLSAVPALLSYDLGGKQFEVLPVKLVIALVLLAFAIIEILPSKAPMKSSRKGLVAGGLLSGFFGGLAGIQGAIRSAFLIRTGLSKEAYIATGVIIALFVDITRLSVYASRFRLPGIREDLSIVIAAVLAAITGAFLGSRLLKKVTFRFVQVLVTVMLVVVSVALGAGII